MEHLEIFFLIPKQLPNI